MNKLRYRSTYIFFKVRFGSVHSQLQHPIRIGSANLATFKYLGLEMVSGAGPADLGLLLLLLVVLLLLLLLLLLFMGQPDRLLRRLLGDQ